MGFGYIGRHAKHRRLKRLFRTVAVLLVIVLLAWAFLSPKMLRIDTRTIKSPWEDDAQIRIVYVSDLHYGSWPFVSMSDVGGLVSQINEQNPDLVLLGGDYASDPDAAASLFRRIPSIHATYGVYAVLGECDRGNDEQLNALQAVLRQRNIKPLINTTETVRVGTHDLYIAGLDDAANGQPDIVTIASQCRSDSYVILLAHDPSAINDALNINGADGRREWFDLGLFGHTHGGGLFGGGQSGRYVSGWYVPNKQQEILVSNGVGTSGFPMRLGNAPQFHVITISPGK